MTDVLTPIEALPIAKRYRICSGIVIGCMSLSAGYQYSIGNGFSATLYALTALIGVFVSAWSFRAQIVQVHEDGVEVKLGPLAAVKFAPFDGLASVNETKRQIQLKLRRGRGKKVIKIPRYMLEKADQKWLVQKIKYEMAAG